MTETAGSGAASRAPDEAAARDDDQPLAELVEELGRDVGTLVFYEAQLEASRHKPEVHRAARGLAIALVVAIAFLTAFAFANVAALDALSAGLADWLAALVLAAAWVAVGVSLALVLLARARHATGRRSWRASATERRETEGKLVQARDDAAQAVRDSLGRLAPALAIEIAKASLDFAGDVASDVAEGVVEAGHDLLEDSDDMIEEITENLPGGGVVNLMWDVVLLPGRIGVKVATTVIKRTESRN